ncbi:hypothetical protein [Actinoallomurus sp. NPDC050550]|uniref:hypothetical protein n=1 Tax=Actinoallomurus sp. NPDC050550 TaxID=3154937 RepID=UPI003407788B
MPQDCMAGGPHGCGGANPYLGIVPPVDPNGVPESQLWNRVKAEYRIGLWKLPELGDPSPIPPPLDPRDPKFWVQNTKKLVIRLLQEQADHSAPTPADTKEAVEAARAKVRKANRDAIYARARNKRIGSRRTQKLRDKADRALAKAEKKLEAAKAADRAARARAREERRLAAIEPEPKTGTQNNAFVTPQTTPSAAGGPALAPQTPGVPATGNRLGEGSHPADPLAGPSKPAPDPVPAGTAPVPAGPWPGLAPGTPPAASAPTVPGLTYPGDPNNPATTPGFVPGDNLWKQVPDSAPEPPVVVDPPKQEKPSPDIPQDCMAGFGPSGCGGGSPYPGIVPPVGPNGIPEPEVPELFPGLLIPGLAAASPPADNPAPAPGPVQQHPTPEPYRSAPSCSAGAASAGGCDGSAGNQNGNRLGEGSHPGNPSPGNGSSGGTPSTGGGPGSSSGDGSSSGGGSGSDGTGGGNADSSNTPGPDTGQQQAEPDQENKMAQDHSNEDPAKRV